MDYKITFREIAADRHSDASTEERITMSKDRYALLYKRNLFLLKYYA